MNAPRFSPLQWVGLQICYRYMIRSMFLVTLVLAIYVFVGREGIGLVPSYQDWMKEKFSQALGTKVQFSQARGYWQGLSPLLRIHDLSIQDVGDSKGASLQAAVPISIAQLDVKLNIFASLASRSVKFSLIKVEGFNLDLATFWQTLGSLGSAGVQADENAKEKPKLWQDRIIQLLFQNNLIAINNSRVTYAQGDLTKVVHIDSLAMGWSAGAFHIKGRLSQGSLVDGAANSISLLGKIPGRPRLRSELSGSLFINLNRQNFRNFIDYIPSLYREKIKLYGKYPIDEAIGKIHASFKAWINFRGGVLTSFDTALDINDYVLKLQEQDELLPKVLRFRGRWTAIEDGWLVNYRLDYPNSKTNLKTQRQGLSGRVQLSKAALPQEIKRATQTERHYWKLSVETLALSDFLMWVDFLGLNRHFEKLPLGELNAKGLVQHLLVAMPAQVELLTDDSRRQVMPDIEQIKWQLKVTDLAWDSVQHYPEVSGLDVVAWGDMQQGVAHLTATDLNLNWPTWFRKQHQHLSLDLPIHWQQQAYDASWVVRSGLIELIAQDAKLKALLSLNVPKANSLDAEQSNRLDLTQGNYLSWIARIYEADVASTSGYLPVPKLPQPLVTWLDGFLVGGNLVQGDLQYHGRASKPGPAQINNQLSMRFQVDDARLDYAPGWPALTDARVDAKILGDAVRARLYEGKILDASVTGAEVVLDEMPSGRRPEVKISGQAVAATTDGLEILKQSPVNDRLGDFLGSIHAAGELDVSLSVNVPLVASESKESLPPEVEVKARTEDSQLHLHQADLLFNHIQGDFKYTSLRGVEADQFTAQLFGKPIQGDIQALQPKRQVPVTQIQFRGDVSVEALKSWLPSVFYQGIEGETAYRARVQFPQVLDEQASSPPSLEVMSNLVGIEAKVPEPIAKSAKEFVNFRFLMPLGNAKPWMKFFADGRFSLAVAPEPENPEIVRGVHFLFGAGDPKLPTADKLFISGELKAADLDVWYQYLNALDKDAVVSAKKFAGPPEKPIKTLNSKTNVDTNTDWYAWVGDVDLVFDQVTYKGNHLNHLGMRMSPIEQSWVFSLSGPEASGIVRLPLAYVHGQETGQTPPIELELIHLDISGFNTQSDTAASDATAKDASKGDLVNTFDPQAYGMGDWPPLEVRVRELKDGSKRLGDWDFNLVFNEQQVVADRLKIAVNNLQVSGQMHWDISSANQKTQVVAELSAQNTADILRAWGISPSLTSKKAQGRFDLSWPGPAFKPDLQSMKGFVRVNLKDGQLLSVDNATSSVKVIGLLNFSTLQRRLQLDFSDLYKKGLPYDELDGYFVFDQGHVDIQAFNMRGPSTEFKSSGHADLAQGTIDQRLKATVPVSKNLILPAAATGGLPAAVTMYVIDKAFGDKLDKLTTFKFKIQGPWEDPEVTRIKN